MKCSKSAAFHESGHAIVAAHLGAAVDFVAVQSTNGRSIKLPNGYKLRDEGFSRAEAFVDAAAIRAKVTPDDPLYIGVVREIAVAMGGIMSQAKAVKISPAKAVLAGGAADLAAALALLDHIGERDRAASWNRSMQIVRYVMRSRWSIITSLAGMLMRDGYVQGSAVNAMVPPKNKDKKLEEMHALVDELTALAKLAWPDEFADL